MTPHDVDRSTVDRAPGEADCKADCQLAPAAIRLIYESRDGRFCLFEDANGHITSVRASKLA